ncbi:MAG: hypothetical protein AAF399_12475 [Bacteroidota bacterium]
MQAITIQGNWGESLLNQEPLQRFRGKRVIVTIIELDELPTTSKREWNLLGSYPLGGKLDEVNVQDFARE